MLVETKVKRNAVKTEQLKRHLERLDEAVENTKLVLLLTPDDARPAAVDAFQDNRLVWSSFAALDQAIDEMLADKYEVISEREAFLLRELQNMLMAEDLVNSANDVVVVPARNAWPEYQQYHAYVCQPDRPFQQVTRMAFYAHGHIHPLVPLILESHGSYWCSWPQPRPVSGSPKPPKPSMWTRRREGDLILLKHLGFDLKETTEGSGRKVWRIDKSLGMPKTAQQEYRMIAELLDALMERIEEIDDKGFRIDLQAYQMTVRRKLKPR